MISYRNPEFIGAFVRRSLVNCSHSLETLDNSVSRNFETTPIYRVEMGPFGAIADPHALTGSQQQLSLVGRGHLHNRSWLCSRLDLENTPQITDGKLLLTAYARWGKQCVDNLLGEFAFALWDEQQRALFCVRDHMGRVPFYYWANEEIFLFSSNPQLILAHPASSLKPNHTRLAMLSLPVSGLLDTELTFYEGIYALDGASSCRVDATNLIKTEYWQPDRNASLKIPDNEIAEAFRELLFDAVRVRLPETGSVAALLSGGLDSSAIVAVAEVIQRQKNQPLITLSSVVPDALQSAYKDERYYIDRAAGEKVLQKVYVSVPDAGPFDQLDQLFERVDHPMVLSRHYLYTAFAEEAAGRGITTILDGAGGEFGPSFHGDGYYPELFLSGRWQLLFHELTLKATVRGHSKLRTLLSELVKPFIPTFTLSPSNRGAAFRPLQWEAENQIIQPAYVHSVLQEHLPVLQDRLHRTIKTYHDHKKNQCKTILAARKGINVGRSFIGADQIKMSLPFLDKRILEFCLAAPGHWKVHNGYNRYLIRAALDGLLDPEIQWRTTKTPFSPDYPHRFNRSLPKVQGFLKGISASDPIRTIVNVPLLQNYADHTMQSNWGRGKMGFAALHSLPMGIYLIHFLRRFPEFS